MRWDICKCVKKDNLLSNSKNLAKPSKRILALTKKDLIKNNNFKKSKDLLNFDLDFQIKILNKI